MDGKNQNNNKWIYTGGILILRLLVKSQIFWQIEISLFQRCTVYIIILILLTGAFSFSKTKKTELKRMFYHPVNLNSASEKEIKKSLALLGFGQAKIVHLISFIRKTPKPISNFYIFVRHHILSPKESLILSRFFILKEDGKKRFFESESEEEYLSNENRAYDADFKINLNRFNKEQFLSLAFVNQQQLNAIIQYRKEKGKFTTIYELLLIPEITSITFIRLKPYLKKLSDDIAEHPNSIELRYRRIETSDQNDTINTNYFYSKVNVLLAKGIEFKFAAIKKDDQQGYYPGALVADDTDYLRLYRQYSISLFIERDDIGLSKLVVGDYALRFGQHLIFGTPFQQFLDKIDKAPIKKSDSGIRRFSNPNRLGALRGLAFSKEIGLLQLTPFVFFNSYELSTNRFSRRGVDISLERLVTDGTTIEEDKSQSEDLIEGGGGVNCTLNLNDTLKLGFNFALFSFSETINPDVSDSEDEKLFHGDQLYLSSLYFDWTVSKQFNFYGETALAFYEDSISNKTIVDTGLVLGGIASFKTITYSFLIRYLGAQFHSPHATTVIDERRNEMGLFQGFYWQCHKSFNIRLYLDLFKPLNRKKLNTEFSVKVNYQVMHDLLFSYLFTITYKPYYNSYRTRMKNQCNVEYCFTKDLAFRMRYENVMSKRENESVNCYGNLFYIQLKYQMELLTAIIRITAYQTDSYDAAVYALENQLFFWYNGIDSYSDEGVKYNLLLKAKLERVWLGFKMELDNRKKGRQFYLDKKLFFQLIFKW